MHVFDASTLPWQATGNPGLKLKAVRNDDERGEFLGLVSFAPFVRSAVHQHTGWPPASWSMAASPTTTAR